METPDYSPSIAKNYIKSAIERVSALIDLFGLSPDSCDMIISDLENALAYLVDDDLPEMDIDEFMAIAGEDMSFDPFDSFDDISGGRSGNEMMIWADEYPEEDFQGDELDDIRTQMMRLQDELRVLKDNQKRGIATREEEARAQQYEAILYQLMQQHQLGSAQVAQGYAPGLTDGSLDAAIQNAGAARAAAQGRAAERDRAIQEIADMVASRYYAEQQAMHDDVAEQQAAARRAAESLQQSQPQMPDIFDQASFQDAGIMPQPQSQMPAQQAFGQQRPGAQPNAQQPQPQQQTPQQQMNAERAARERQRFMTEQQVKRAAATGKKVTVLSPQAMTTPDTIEIDLDPATVELGLDIDHVPFCASEFDVKRANETSSMYVECWNKSIGEWDMGTLLSEEAMDVVEFQISGTLDDGAEAYVSWNAEHKVITAQVSSTHQIGMLTEATAGTQRQAFVKTARPDISTILEEAPAGSAAEALSFLTEVNIQTIEVDIVYNGNNFALHFADRSADIEVGWVYDKTITSSELAYLILYLSGVLAEYAVPKGADKAVWNKERINSTMAGYYHNNKTKYSAEVNKARTGSRMLLDLSAITVTEEGMLSVKKFTPQTQK